MSTPITAVSEILDALDRVPFILSVLTKGSLLVLIAVALTRLLSRAPAAARHLVWSLSVAGLLLLPATTLVPWRLELTTLAAARDAVSLTGRTTSSTDTRETPSPTVPTAAASADADASVPAPTPSVSEEVPTLTDDSFTSRL